ncbi:MAG: RNA 2',3'-cyclic phosphodiesterase [Chlorobiaceae bacterium]|nr:RNA 2',3'-cyclic phosphodiesterase [Chlorobiaceae bacterium]
MAKKTDITEKRVFIGIPTEKELNETLRLFRKDYNTLPVRWLKPVNLHLTIVPPWQCSSVEPVCAMLSEAASAFQDIDVLFTRVSAGPDARKPRILWATGSAPSILSTLQQYLSALLSTERQEKRSFLLHLTIARIRFENQAIIASRMPALQVQWPATLRKICLYESILKPSGADYNVLCEVPFGLNAPAGKSGTQGNPRCSP